MTRLDRDAPVLRAVAAVAAALERYGAESFLVGPVDEATGHQVVQLGFRLGTGFAIDPDTVQELEIVERTALALEDLAAHAKVFADDLRMAADNARDRYHRSETT